MGTRPRQMTGSIGLSIAVLMLVAIGVEGFGLSGHGAPFVVSSGLFYFRMDPDPDGMIDDAKARGGVYRTGLGGRDLLMWETSGWYERIPAMLVLSPEGEFLARFRLCDEFADTALVMYRRGEVFQTYRLADLATHQRFIYADEWWGYVYLDLSRPPRFVENGFEMYFVDSTSRVLTIPRPPRHFRMEISR